MKQQSVWQSRSKVRQVCLMCKDYLNELDVKNGCAVCWNCRRLYWPMHPSMAKWRSKRRDKDSSL